MDRNKVFALELTELDRVLEAKRYPLEILNSLETSSFAGDTLYNVQMYGIWHSFRTRDTPGVGGTIFNITMD